MEEAIPSAHNDPCEPLTPEERLSFLNSTVQLPSRLWKRIMLADEPDTGIETYTLMEDNVRRLGSIMIKGDDLRVYRNGLHSRIAFNEHNGFSTVEALLSAADLINEQDD